MRSLFAGRGIGLATAAAALSIGGLGPNVMTSNVDPKEQPRRPAPKPRKSRLPSPRLNRSRNWRYARSYAEARAMSPFPDRPVR